MFRAKRNVGPMNQRQARKKYKGHLRMGPPSCHPIAAMAVSCILSAGILTGQVSFAVETTDVLKPLTGIQQGITSKLNEIQASIRATVEEGVQANAESGVLKTFEEKLKLLEAQKSEYQLRQDFAYRL